ncbi:hypothetical protein [Altererythrobacter fulvus]|uniref:hypothetical protein n=1 Tax=Caenibius fulvus TaxID=2126012 RepID=UPI00301B1906
MGLTAAHWVFFAVTISMLFAMAVRRGVIILAMLGIIALALLSPNAGQEPVDQAIFAAQAMFRAAIVGGTRLFDTILLVGFMGALLHVLREEGIDRVMLMPFAGFMRGPRTAFIMIALATYLFSLFFWPTPTVLMIGALLAPLAVRAGLSPLATGMAMSMAGHGMALSADPLIQAAARITGAPGGLAPSAILPMSLLFSIVIGLVALGVSLAWAKLRPREADLAAVPEGAGQAADVAPPTRRQIALAIVVPALLGATAVLSIMRPSQTADNGMAVALMGGMAVVLLIITCVVQHGTHALDSIVDMMSEGFFLVIRIFAPVVPVLGFFMIGEGTSAEAILGPGTPGFVYALGEHFALSGPLWCVLLPVAMVIVGAISGRDGIAFQGLPLAGTIAVMLSDGNVYQGAVLASLAQVATIWVGAGVLLSWSGVRTVANEVWLDREELANANRWPVIAGLAAGAVAAMVLLLRHGA